MQEDFPEDAREVLVVPAVQAADQVFAFYSPVGHQGAAMQAAAVQDGVLVAGPDDDQVDVSRDDTDRLAFGQVAPGSDAV